MTSGSPQGCDEFTSDATLLRYVATLNPGATRKQFIEACVEAGYRADSSGKRFYESRVFDRDSYGMVWLKDGSLVEE